MSSIVGLLERAVGGDQEATGVLLARYRPYLKILARRRLDTAVSVRVDPSDVVQQTCLEAFRDLKQFRGTAEGEFTAWLRRILENNVCQSIQIHMVAQKRSITREQQVADSAQAGLQLASVAGRHSSPSSRVMWGELAVRLAGEIEALPDDQREAIRLRHLEGWSLEELASRFERSESAVAGLLKRGLRTLRRQFSDLS